MKQHVTKLAFAGLVGAIVAGGFYSQPVDAHSGAKGVVKKRMDLMGRIGKAQKSLAAMFSGKQPYDAAKVRAEAKKIAGHSGSKISKLFPKGSAQHPSEATAAIWKNWQEFQELAKELETFATALADNAGNKAGTMGSNHMMGSNDMMGSGGMMSGDKPSVKEQKKMLENMPPIASFQRVAQTCQSCHTRFRLKKK